MTSEAKLLAKVREICLSYPNSKETMTWGNPHFRVGEKIFCGFGESKGVSGIGFKLEMSHAKSIIKDHRFTPAPYVGHKGWVSMDLTGSIDWVEVRKLINESYCLIAPKKLVQQIGLVSVTKKSPLTRKSTAASGKKTATSAGKKTAASGKTAASACKKSAASAKEKDSSKSSGAKKTKTKKKHVQ